MHKIATIISRIFDPFVTLGVAFVILLARAPVFIPACIVMVVLPFILFVVAVKIHIVSNWDVTDRRERPKILWSLVVIESISLFVFQLWSLLPILLAIVGFALISHFWKISGHAMAAAMATGIVVATYGWTWWPALLIVPLVGWSRVVRKNHTVAQVIVGALFAWVVVYLFL